MQDHIRRIETLLAHLSDLLDNHAHHFALSTANKALIDVKLILVEIRDCAQLLVDAAENL